VKVDNITLRLVLALKLRHTKKFKLIILMFIGKWRSGRSNNNLRSYCRLWLGKVRLQKILRNLYRLAFFVSSWPLMKDDRAKRYSIISIKSTEACTETFSLHL